MLLGAKGELLDYAVRYGRILMLSLPTFALQNMFQSFFVTAEKPHLGFYFTVAAGCTNMVLDVLMVGVWGWGVEGAAIATFLSQIVGGLLPIFYFLDHKNTSRLHLCKTQLYSKVLLDACINGSCSLPCMWATPSAVRPSSASTTVQATVPRCTTCMKRACGSLRWWPSP